MRAMAAAALATLILLAAACAGSRMSGPRAGSQVTSVPQAPLPQAELPERAARPDQSPTAAPVPAAPAALPGPPAAPALPTGAKPASAAAASELAPLAAPVLLAAETQPFTGTLLIADAGNNRLLELAPDQRLVWQFPAPGSLVRGQTFHYPDDAFFSPDGRYISVNEEYSHTVAVIAYPTGKIVWQYGEPGVAGRDLRHFDRPDDAHLLPDGQIVVADIRNCRLLFIPWDQAQPRSLGTPADCRGKPGTFARPDGVTPLANDRLLVTEINSRHVSEIDRDGRVLRATTVPINYLSDAYLTARDTIIVSDYHSPGRVVEADWRGQILWAFPPAGSRERLDRPSIAFELPNGNVVISDDHRHRVIVVNHAGQVLWQYGVTDVPGAAPGYLNTPDGLDLHQAPAASAP